GQRGALLVDVARGAQRACLLAQGRLGAGHHGDEDQRVHLPRRRVRAPASAEKIDYKSTAGLCPGAADIQCCTKVSAPAGCGELKDGEKLTPGEDKKSCDGVYKLAMQNDGNLVLYHG